MGGDAQRVVTVADVVVDAQVVALLQPGPPTDRVAAGRLDQRGARRDQRSAGGVDDAHAGNLGQPGAEPLGEPVIALLDRAGADLSHPRDRHADAGARRQVEGALLLVARGGGSGRRGDGAEALLEALPDVQHAGAGRREQPLVQAGRVQVAVAGADVDRHAAHRLRAVDGDDQAVLAAQAAQVLDRIAHAAAGDVAERQDPGARGDRGAQRLDQLRRVFDRTRQGDLAHHQPLAGGPVAPRLHPDRVLVAGGEDLVAGAQAAHAVGGQRQPYGSVAVDGELLRAGSHERRQLRHRDLGVVAAVVDLAGVRVLRQPQIAFVHGGDHRVRRHAERGAVQVDQVGVQRKPGAYPLPTGFVVARSRRSPGDAHRALDSCMGHGADYGSAGCAAQAGTSAAGILAAAGVPAGASSA